MLSFTYLKQTLLFSFFIASTSLITAQEDSLLQKRNPHIGNDLNMDASANRPTITGDDSPVSIGGYLEANSMYSVEDGETDGLSFQARRLSIFLSATIAKRITFLSEIEFEDGGKEIEIEYAAVDFAFHPLLNFRGGIIVNPIGAFNQNHDGPKWEFVERPNEAAGLLPGTFSNAGAGIYGKTYSNDWVFGYEAYVTNGFNSRIINNENDRTSLPAAKEDAERFEENFSGQALFTTKFAVSHRDLGEIGVSYMGGQYNKEMEDGAQLDTKARRVDVLALDFNTTIKKTGTSIIGEAAHVWIDVPHTYTQQYGDRQWGGFVDVVQPVVQRKMFDWEKAKINLAARLDYVDYNIGKFNQTGGDIGDELIAITPAISFRPTAQTVLRLNYRYEWKKDILNNPNVHTATWYFGLSTYF